MEIWRIRVTHREGGSVRVSEESGLREIAEIKGSLVLKNVEIVMLLVLEDCKKKLNTIREIKRIYIYIEALRSLIEFWNLLIFFLTDGISDTNSRVFPL